jgi:hypothetical protein
VIVEDSGLLGYDAMSLGLCFPAFQKNIVMSPSGVEGSRNKYMYIHTYIHSIDP